MTILITGFLVLARVSGLVTSMPLLSTRLIPTVVKALLVMVITLILTPVLPIQSEDLGFGLLLVSVGAEFMLGVLISLILVDVS